MTGYEFRKRFSESQLKEMSRDIAGSIVIRSYDRNGSHDDRRASTAPEKEIIQKIAYGALLSYGSASDMESIIMTAEYMLDLFIPECNGYMTLNIPLSKIMGQN